jgi:hypothetical protein
VDLGKFFSGPTFNVSRDPDVDHFFCTDKILHGLFKISARVEIRIGASDPTPEISAALLFAAPVP